MVSPFLFFAGERLSLAELTAACLDGSLVALGEGFMPADAVETPWMRAHSLRPLLGERWAAVRLSAAWVHGGCDDEPRHHHAQRAGAIRPGACRHPRVTFHDVRMAADDLASIGGVRVSTPGRTLVDLARAGDDQEIAVAREWMRSDPAVRIAAEHWLRAHPRFPYGRRAAAELGLEPGPATKR